MKGLIWLAIVGTAIYFGVDHFFLNSATEAVAAAPIATASEAMATAPAATTAEEVAKAVGFLVIGGIWFWITFVFFIFIAFACIDYEKEGWLTFATIVFFAMLYFLGNGAVWVSWLLNHWLLVVLLFIPTGLFIYMPAKLIIRLQSIKSKLKEYKSKFLEKYNINQNLNEPIPDSHQTEWLDYRAEHCLDLLRSRSFVRNNLGDMFVWVVYWPLYLAWDIFHYPVRWAGRLLRKIVKEGINWMKGGFGKLRDAMYKDIDKDY